MVDLTVRCASVPGYFLSRAPVVCACAISLVVSLAASSGHSTAAEDSAIKLNKAELRFFETKIRPVLVKHCYSCHSSDSKKVQGNLLLDTRENVRRGGDSGPAVVPGDPHESLLIQAVRYDAFEMPPDETLPEAVIADLVKWVEMGAPDPRDGSAPKINREIDLEQEGQFWSFQPPKKPKVPHSTPSTWARSAIDCFILERLEQENLAPVPDADRRRLIRRVFFDLVGLPPTPEAVRAFVTDPASDALTKVVDRLLASPHFGERWGRHWLDVTRFAESSGGGRSLMFENAWRFRDYVIASWNDDKPYDQLVREHIAGDLLPHETRAQRCQQLTAVGFLVLGPINYELQDKELLRMEVIDEQIESMGRAFLGMTIGCARCHDHKFDPIPTSDYYGLAGIFRSTKSLVPGNVSGYVQRPLPVSDQQEQALQEYEKKQSRLKKQLAAAKRESDKSDEPTNQSQAARKVKRLQRELNELAAHAPAPRPVVMSVQDHEEIADCHISIQGNVRNLGPKVPRGFLKVATPVDYKIVTSPETSGRLELANWIARPDNPLTARVMVNRIWHHLFGEGLVRTTDNFGSTGEPPSHPELLDYLAVTLVEEGWSIKRMIRQLVLSRTYQLSSEPGAGAAQIDPENRLRAHANRRRLDAECIRDAMLVVSGQLDLTAGGLTIRKLAQYDLGYEFDTVRRSVYVPWFRNSMLDLLDVFDAANPNVVTGRRNVSTLPTQSLYLMNSPFVMQQAAHAAKLLLDEPGLDNRGRIDRIYERALGRPPSAAESEIAIQYVLGDEGIDARDAVENWTGLCHLVFACLDFCCLD